MEKHGPGQAAKPPAPSWTTAVAQPAAARSSVAALATRDLRKNRGKSGPGQKTIQNGKNGETWWFYHVLHDNHDVLLASTEKWWLINPSSKSSI